MSARVTGPSRIDVNQATIAGQGRRWPLHPPPFPDETTTSWLRRLAAAYRIRTEDFLAWYVGLERGRVPDLDLTIPNWVAHALAVGTGLEERRIQAMSLDDTASGVPIRFELFGARACLLLGHDTIHGQLRQSCSACLAEDAEPYLRRAWRLTSVVECPVHRILLAEDRENLPRQLRNRDGRRSLKGAPANSILKSDPTLRSASRLQRLIGEGLGTGRVDLGWTSIPADQLAATLAITDAILIACDPEYQPWVKLVRMSYEHAWTLDVRPIDLELGARRMHRLARIAEALLNWPRFVTHKVIEDGTGFIAATQDPHDEVPIGACDAMRLQAWIDALPAPLARPFEIMDQSEFRRLGRWLNRRWLRITVWEKDLLAANFLESRASLVTLPPGSAV